MPVVKISIVEGATCSIFHIEKPSKKASKGKRASYIQGDKSVLKDRKQKPYSNPAVNFGITHASCCLRLITHYLWPGECWG